jgi:hypothetical protein
MPVGKNGGGTIAVDRDRFDGLARTLAGGASRRAVLVAAGASGLGALGLAALLGGGEAEAKQGDKGKKRKRRRRRRCKLTNLRGKTCGSDKECCTNKKYVCGTPFGGAETDPEECCGGLGAPCDFPSDCCAGNTCSALGACAEVKEA